MNKTSTSSSETVLQAKEQKLTEAQRSELDRRIDAHKNNPGRGVSLNSIAEKLGVHLSR